MAGVEVGRTLVGLVTIGLHGITTATKLAWGLALHRVQHLSPGIRALELQAVAQPSLDSHLKGVIPGVRGRRNQVNGAPVRIAPRITGVPALWTIDVVSRRRS